jgi:hypothetical protein
MRRLGYDGDRTLRFIGIPQPWLRELTKRWVRWRLSTGLSLEAGGGRPVVVLTRFARFLADIGVERIDGIDRSTLERYLADLRGDRIHAQRRGTHVGLLNRFFAIRQHHWDTALPAEAMFFTEDYPKREERCRGRWQNTSAHETGQPRPLRRPRPVDHDYPDAAGCGSPTRCGYATTVAADAEGAPYLRYLNHKMKRRARAYRRTARADADHRTRTAQRWPAGTRIN